MTKHMIFKLTLNSTNYIHKDFYKIYLLNHISLLPSLLIGVTSFLGGLEKISDDNIILKSSHSA